MERIRERVLLLSAKSSPQYCDVSALTSNIDDLSAPLSNSSIT
jgi:hypothetical protein